MLFALSQMVKPPSEVDLVFLSHPELFDCNADLPAAASLHLHERCRGICRTSAPHSIFSLGCVFVDAGDFVQTNGGLPGGHSSPSN